MRLSALPIANADLSAVLRVGDIHSGKEDCTEAYDRAVAAQWSAFSQPHGYNIPNFRRITVHGSTTPLEYLKLTIDPTASAENGTEAFGLFSCKRVNPL